MVSFGAPPESNELSYPGISGKRFDPISAQKCWADVIKTENNAGYVHRVLDGKGKLGLPEAWAKDVSRNNGMLPSYESLDEVYYMTGWKQNKFGASEQPDVNHLIPAMRKVAAERKKNKKPKRERVSDLIDIWEETGITRDPPRTKCSVRSLVMDNGYSVPVRDTGTATPMRKELLSRSSSAPGLVAPAAPAPPPHAHYRASPPLAPPPGVRTQQRAAPPTPALSVAAMSQTLPSMRARSVMSGSSRASVRRDKIASLVSSEFTAQCSEALAKLRRQ